MARSKSALFVVGVLGVFGTAVDARAQGGADPRWDTSAITGLFLGHPADVGAANQLEHWYHTGTFAITAGRYLTRHLKAEGEVMISGEGERFVQQLVQVPGVGPFPVGSEHMAKTNGISANLTWQFLDNQWIHPFVFAGAAVDFDRGRVHTWAQSYYRGDPRVPGNQIVISQDGTDDLGTTKQVRALIGTGAKVYMTPRAFFRADTRIGAGGDSTGHIALRCGFGLDF